MPSISMRSCESTQQHLRCQYLYFCTIKQAACRASGAKASRVCLCNVTLQKGKEEKAAAERAADEKAATDAKVQGSKSQSCTIRQCAFVVRVLWVTDCISDVWGISKAAEQKSNAVKADVEKKADETGAEARKPEQKVEEAKLLNGPKEEA